MKRNYILNAFILIFTCSSFAQVSPKEFEVIKTTPTQINAVHEAAYPSYYKKGTKANERWYCYALTMEKYWGGSVFYGGFLFPDSTILVDYGASGYSHPWIHSLADVFDPTSVMFNDPTLHPGELTVTNNSTYALDSIMVYGRYRRHLANKTIVDTLRIEVQPVYMVFQLFFFANNPVTINLNVDTVKFYGLNYDYLTNTLDAPAKVTYDILLTDSILADTMSGGWSEFSVSTANLPNMVQGNQLATTVTFIPGYTWKMYGGTNPSPSPDTLTSVNSFEFVSYKEVAGAFPYYTKGDYNVSYIVSPEARYNDAGTWNGMYLPSFAYQGISGSYWIYEHHRIHYKATCISCPTGMENYISSKEMSSLGDAFPNPAHSSSEIVIPVTVTSTHVRLIITDMLGQNIMYFNTNELKDGKVIVNASALKQGVYCYMLEDIHSSVSKKFVVIN